MSKYNDIMESLMVCIYTVKFNNYYRAFITHNPVIDAAAAYNKDPGAQLDVLSPFVHIGIGHYILNKVFSKEEINGCPLPTVRGVYDHDTCYNNIVLEKAGKILHLVQKMKHLFKNGLAYSGLKYPMRINVKDSAVMFPGVPGSILSAVRYTLSGKILFFEEIEKSLVENGFALQARDKQLLIDVLQVLSFYGEIEVLPSLGLTPSGRVLCIRCGTQFDMSASILEHMYCSQCGFMGESRLNRALFARRGFAAKAGYPGLEPAGLPSLSPAQKHASKELLGFIKNRTAGRCLLWAVAGAGKTEVVLDSIASVLQEGGRVLYTAPRRDVVREIYPRLKSAFPGIDILASYGGSDTKFIVSPLTAATAHQVIKYYRCFDLVIIDEVDAYPFKDNQMLNMAVHRAVKTEGQVIYLTATPDKKILRETEKGCIKLITIPARFHGFPVPEPELMKLTDFKKDETGKWVLEPVLLHMIQKWVLELDRQVFIFLPTVRMIERFGPVLEREVLSWKHPKGKKILCFSHAKDPHRDSKIAGFKAGDFRVIVTTTIMERGITVKNSSVLVLKADFEKVFDEGTLIQMAGRAGRSPDFPFGEVVFVAEKNINSAMKSARANITHLNRVARRNGFLKKGV